MTYGHDAILARLHSMTQEEDEPDEGDKLRDELVRHTIIEIEDCLRGDRIFAIIVQKGNKRKRVVISANDLGWWIEKVEELL